MRRILLLARLRTFELAASQLSFELAAKDLHLTVSAVSHQIRGLERHIRRPLFQRRSHRRVTTTPEGHRLHNSPTRVLGALEAACAGLELPRLDPMLAVQDCDSDCGPTLTAHPGVYRFVFTGSVATGRQVVFATAYRLLPAVVELGEKQTDIVPRDAVPASRLSSSPGCGNSSIPATSWCSSFHAQHACARLPGTNLKDDIRRASDNTFYLSAGIYTKNIGTAHRLATRLHAGQPYINRWFGGCNETPFSGGRHSQYGLQKAQEPENSYTRTNNAGVLIVDVDPRKS